MSSTASVVAIIPARGGSRGIPKKNLIQVAGKSLLEWAVRTAQTASLIDEVFVSTDDEEIQRQALLLGAMAPFLRPKRIASDFSRDFDFVSHFLSYYRGERGDYPSLIVHLRPTVPIRRATVVDSAIIELQNHKAADSLRSVNVASTTPYKMWTKNKSGFGAPFATVKGVPETFNSPRQSLPVVFEQNCYVDIYRVSSVLKSGSLASGNILLFETEATVDIDSELDLEIARMLARQDLRR